MVYSITYERASLAYYCHVHIAKAWAGLRESHRDPCRQRLSVASGKRHASAAASRLLLRLSVEWGKKRAAAAFPSSEAAFLYAAFLSAACHTLQVQRCGASFAAARHPPDWDLIKRSHGKHTLRVRTNLLFLLPIQNRCMPQFVRLQINRVRSRHHGVMVGHDATATRHSLFFGSVLETAHSSLDVSGVCPNLGGGHAAASLPHAITAGATAHRGT
jgi:hypothetical protein